MNGILCLIWQLMPYYDLTLEWNRKEDTVKHLLSVAIVVASIIVVGAQSSPVSGTWTVVANVSGNQSEQTCTFTQQQAELTGTCKGERGSFPITGKVESATVTWQFEVDYEGQKLTPVYAGKLDGDKIVGSVDVQGMGVGGEFTATRAK